VVLVVMEAVEAEAAEAAAAVCYLSIDIDRLCHPHLRLSCTSTSIRSLCEVGLWVDAV
jgi:hypothetical protein